MIYSCDYCVNRHDCHENKEEYTKACDLIAATLYEIEHNPDYLCWYSCSMKCDYWIEDKELCERENYE